jgi:hypothetical protein
VSTRARSDPIPTFRGVVAAHVAAHVAVHDHDHVDDNDDDSRRPPHDDERALRAAAIVRAPWPASKTSC